MIRTADQLCQIRAAGRTAGAPTKAILSLHPPVMMWQKISFPGEEIEKALSDRCI